MNLVRTKFNFPDASPLSSSQTKTNKKFCQESFYPNSVGWLIVFVMWEDILSYPVLYPD